MLLKINSYINGVNKNISPSSIDWIICLLCVYICHYIFSFYYLDIFVVVFLDTLRQKALLYKSSRKYTICMHWKFWYFSSFILLLLIYILNTVRVVLDYGPTSPLLRSELSAGRVVWHSPLIPLKYKSQSDWLKYLWMNAINCIV